MEDSRYGRHNEATGLENKQLETVREREEWVAKVFRSLDDRNSKILDKEIEALRKEDVEGVMCSILELFDFGICYLAERDSSAPRSFFPRLLEECLNPGTINIAGKTSDEEKFFQYCYTIWQGAYFAMIANPDGQTYKEFVNEVLVNLGILSLQESESKEFEEINKRICQNFSQYISNVNNKRQDYWNNMQAVCTNHRGISEKNKNKEYPFKPIKDFQRTLCEFEFLIRKRNKKENIELGELNNTEENKSSRKLDEIDNKLEMIAEERMKKIAESLKESAFDLKNFRRKYRKFINKNIADMKDTELCTYLSKFFIYKYKYIMMYGKEEFFGIEKLYAIDELNLTRLEYEGNHTFYYQNHFMKIGELFLYKKEENQDIYEPIRRKAMRLLINRLDGLMCEFEKAGIYRRWDDLIKDKKLLHEHKDALKELPRFTSKEAENEIKTKFLDKLTEKKSYLEDFIEVSILTKKINLWTADRNNEFEKYMNLDRAVYKKLAKAFFEISIFLKQCAKIEDKKINGEKYDVRVYTTQLQKRLKEMECDIGKIDPDPQYDLRKNYKSIIDKKRKIGYFKLCEETQFTRLYIMLINQYCKERIICVESFVKKYLDSILDRNLGQEQLVKKGYQTDISEKFFGELLISQESPYPANPYSEEIHSKRIRIRTVMRKYVDITCFAVEAREVNL